MKIFVNKNRMRKSKFWFLVFGYVMFIYITLPFARFFWGELYKILGKNGMEFLVISIAWATIGVIFGQLRRISLKNAFIGTAVSFFLFLGAVLLLKRPEERIHLLEYGVLGVLIYRAWSSSFRFSWVGGLSLILLVGTMDEVLQALLPNRVGDPRDVIMNFIGGVWGLWLARLYSSS